MNERIKELAAIARGQAIVGTTVDEEQWRRHEEFVEKFAELIVQECLAIIQTEVSMKYKDGWEQHGVSDDWAAGHYNASLESRVFLKKHFGVEE